MKDYIDWEDEEDSLNPEDWTDEDITWWNKFLPFLKTALYESTMDEIREMEALPDVEIEFSDDFKRSMNKIFREAFGENCKVPHPEVDNTSETTVF
ncbi:MAG: hypothetical protein IJ300_10355 [Clostridia bacterium]|nr:hypothetical protein [Clostridia bacterium]MBQ8146382.1 hypothetical protein [Clostridia bacterium]